MTGMMRVVAVPAAALLLAGSALSARAQGEPETTPEDQALVDMFFKDKITAVRRSRDTADDIELIAEMLDRAANVPDSPAVQWLMYESAVDLGMTSEVYAAAIEAAMAMREAFPEADAMSDESLLVLLEQVYRSARRSDRPEVAGPYLSMLLKVAEASESGGDVDRAGRLYRTGVSVARAVRSEEGEVFEGHVRRLNEIEQLEARIRQLASALAANPRNSGAARELTMIYVLERHDLAAAAEIVELTRDADLIDAVTMGAGGASEAGASEALRVGDWYYALSQDNEPHAAYLLAESLAYYDRFLSEYDRDDALRSRVSTMRLLVAAGLEELTDQRAEAARGEWVDALARFDTETQTIKGEHEILPRGGGLRVGHWSSMVVPFETDAGYDIRLSVRCTGGDDGLIFFLPMGDEACVLNYARDNTTISVSGGPRNQEEENMLFEGREAELLIQVRTLQNGEYGVMCTLDGEVIVEWVGSPDELHISDSVPPPEEYGHVVTIHARDTFDFKALHVRQPER